MRSLLYLVVSQLGWFACVLGAAHGVPWLGVLFTALAAIGHLLLAQRPMPELKLLASAILLGGVWESGLVDSGLLVYPNGILVPGMAPYWILALWALFAMQFNVLFGWLKGRRVLAAVLGGIAGPLSFRAGAALGAVRFPQLFPALAALSVGWAVLMPTLLALAQRWDGMHDEG
jgi:hypothetical protein